MSQRKIRRQTPTNTKNAQPSEQEQFYNLRNLSDLWNHLGDLLAKSDKEKRDELAGDAYTQAADYLRSAIDIVEKDLFLNQATNEPEQETPTEEPITE